MNRDDRRPAPARKGHLHPSCGHWCYTYDEFRSETEDCQRCRTKAFNNRAVKTADPISRHPEGV